MGYNTTVLILNDFTGSISKSEKFVERLCQMLSSGEVGRVIPGVEIIETHHADDTVTVRVGGNRGVVENVNTFKSLSASEAAIHFMRNYSVPYQIFYFWTEVHGKRMFIGQFGLEQGLLLFYTQIQIQESCSFRELKKLVKQLVEERKRLGYYPFINASLDYIPNEGYRSFRQARECIQQSANGSLSSRGGQHS
jgi:hypothetical protein